MCTQVVCTKSIMRPPRPIDLPYSYSQVGLDSFDEGLVDRSSSSDEWATWIVPPFFDLIKVNN